MKVRHEKIDQNIEVALAYVVELTKTTEKYYIITEEILNDYEIDCKTFISYLCNDMDIYHQDYEVCNQLWAQNRHLYKKQTLINKGDLSDKNIKTIFTEDGDINLEIKLHTRSSK